MAANRRLKEMAATSARLEEILAMTDSERQQNREEIVALLKRVDKMVLPGLIRFDSQSA